MPWHLQDQNNGTHDIDIRSYSFFSKCYNFYPNVTILSLKLLRGYHVIWGYIKGGCSRGRGEYKRGYIVQCGKITAQVSASNVYKHFHRQMIHASPDTGTNMMTSSNGNIFRVTGPLCREFTGYRWIPHTKASDAKLWCFLWSVPE